MVVGSGSEVGPDQPLRKICMAMTSLEGVDDSLYSKDSPPKPEQGKAESVDEQEQMDPTVLVDLKVLTGKDGVKPKVGEERVVKVVAIHGDQAEIAYSEEPPNKSEGGSEDDDLEQLNKSY